MRSIAKAVFTLAMMAASAGARDRSVIDFRVTRTRFVTHNCDQCRGGYEGFRYGHEYRGGPGVFRVETRVYTEFYRGRLVRTWVATEEFFESCAR